jgi:hypothetical protein
LLRRLINFWKSAEAETSSPSALGLLEVDDDNLRSKLLLGFENKSLLGLGNLLREKEEEEEEEMM